MIHVHTTCDACGEPTADRHARAVERAERRFLREAESVMRVGFAGWTLSGPIRKAYDAMVCARQRAKPKNGARS